MNWAWRSTKAEPQLQLLVAVSRELDSCVLAHRYTQISRVTSIESCLTAWTCQRAEGPGRAAHAGERGGPRNCKSEEARARGRFAPRAQLFHSFLPFFIFGHQRSFVIGPVRCCRALPLELAGSGLATSTRHTTTAQRPPRNTNNPLPRPHRPPEPNP